MPRRVRRRRLPLPRAGGRSSEKLLARPCLSQAEPSYLRGTRGFPLDPALGAQPGGVFVSASGATVCPLAEYLSVFPPPRVLPKKIFLTEQSTSAFCGPSCGRHAQRARSLISLP